MSHQLEGLLAPAHSIRTPRAIKLFTAHSTGNSDDQTATARIQTPAAADPTLCGMPVQRRSCSLCRLLCVFAVSLALGAGIVFEDAFRLMLANVNPRLQETKDEVFAGGGDPVLTAGAAARKQVNKMFGNQRQNPHRLALSSRDLLAKPIPQCS